MNAQALPQPQTTTLARVGAVAAIVTGAVLIAKVAVIVATANQINQTIPGVLYIVGVLLPLLAAAGIASAVGGGWLRKTAVFVGVILLHAIYITMLSDGVGALVEQFTAEAYLTDEVPIAVEGLVWLVVGVTLRRRLAATA